MSTDARAAADLPRSGRDELLEDHRREKRIFWKGVLAVAIIAVLVVIRAWWWV